MTLEENMTIALEPKFVFPGIGAVGIENTYVVTPDGMEKLTICDESLITLTPDLPYLINFTLLALSICPPFKILI